MKLIFGGHELGGEERSFSAPRSSSPTRITMFPP
jgi:hypothetical protein